MLVVLCIARVQSKQGLKAFDGLWLLVVLEVELSQDLVFTNIVHDGLLGSLFSHEFNGFFVLAHFDQDVDFE